MMHREDVYCPACSDPETTFRIEDVGMKFDSGDLSAEGMRFRVTRPAWEPVMLAHLRSELDDEEHRRIYDLCVTELMVAGKTAEEAARDQVQGLVDLVTRSMGEAMQQPSARGDHG